MIQASFLRALGLDVRVNSLLDGVSGDAGKFKELQSASNRLLKMGGMGSEYRMMGVTADEVDEQGEVQKAEEDECYPFEVFQPERA